MRRFHFYSCSRSWLFKLDKLRDSVRGSWVAAILSRLVFRCISNSGEPLKSAFWSFPF